METAMQIIFFMLLLELFEIYIQKADTLGGMIGNLYGYYNQSVFLFFMVHPSLYFTLGVLLYFNAFNFFGVMILVLKTFDIFFKVELIKQQYYTPHMDKDLEKMMGMKMTPSMMFLSLITHVPLLYMAIFS